MSLFLSSQGQAKGRQPCFFNPGPVIIQHGSKYCSNKPRGTQTFLFLRPIYTNSFIIFFCLSQYFINISTLLFYVILSSASEHILCCTSFHHLEFISRWTIFSAWFCSMRYHLQYLLIYLLFIGNWEAICILWQMIENSILE